MKIIFAILILFLFSSCDDEKIEWDDCRNCKGTGLVKGCVTCNYSGDCFCLHCNNGWKICAFCSLGHFSNEEICNACKGNYIKGICQFCKGTGKVKPKRQSNDPDLAVGICRICSGGIIGKEEVY